MRTFNDNSVPCSRGSVSIREKKRLVLTILQGHVRHTKNQQFDKSAVAEHSTLKKEGICSIIPRHLPVSRLS